MTTIADLEEDQLAEHLIAGGFLGAFTDIFGNAQPAPINQMLEFDLTDVSANDRVVMIRNTGGVSNPSTNTLFTQRNMIIAIVGNTSAADGLIAKGLAMDIEKYLKENVTDNKCIFNITSSGVNGPFIFDDSRRVHEVNVLVSFNIVRVFD